MTKKKLRNTLLKWTLLIALAGYSVWISVWAHSEANANVCRDIIVNIEKYTGADSITRAGILTELERLPEGITGRKVKSINTARIEKYLSSFSNLEEVECFMMADGNLRVDITPMKPVMRVFSGKDSYYINRAGKTVKSKYEFFVDVPVVSGHFTHDFQPRELLPVVNYVKNDPFLSELVSMTYGRDRDNIILIPRIIGHVINFGDTTRLDEKKEALLLFYQKVIPYKGWEEYDTISVKFKGQVVATRRNKNLVMHGQAYVEDEDPEEATLPAAANDSTANANI